MLQLLSGTKKNIDKDDIEPFKLPKHMEDQMNQNVTSMPNKNDMKSRNSELKSRVSNDRSASKMRTASNNGVSA